MLSHVRANLWLLCLTLVLCCGIYPTILLVVGQTAFHDRAEGSLVYGPDGKPIGSRLIAQPFRGDEFFQPRPSAVSYRAEASGASNWGANNYLLRDRVARQLGPIVKYSRGSKSGQLAGPDIEAWFQADRFQGKLGIVSQWAQAHPALAQNWAKADKLNADYITSWQQSHPVQFAIWKGENPDIREPQAEDLAVLFFTSFSQEHAGRFPGVVEFRGAHGNRTQKIEPIKDGPAIQSIFFDMWRQSHPGVELEPVPADMVMASGSGLDPHITLNNALYQLDRVAAKWAAEAKRDAIQVRLEIETLLEEKAEAPLNGLIGVKLVNVLEMNLALNERYRPAGADNRQITADFKQAMTNRFVNNSASSEGTIRSVGD